jgi:predicted enzyme related to lactoylglutathione lyase
MLRGLTTVNYWADDLEAATRWYTEVLGVEPYFVGAGGGYREFRIGDYQHEFGLVDRRYQPEGVTAGPGGTVVYWHVDDVEAAVDRLVGLGARLHEAPVDRGEGFVTATVIDPFGNILGVMYNPHYLDVLARTGRAAAN